MNRIVAALLWIMLAVPLSAKAIVVEEYFDPATQSGSFGIYNNSTSSIVAFAVANDTVFASDGSHELYRIWATGIITETNWNTGKDIFAAAIGQPVPAFGTLFAGYSKAMVYWAHDILSPAEQAAVVSLA